MAFYSYSYCKTVPEDKSSKEAQRPQVRVFFEFLSFMGGPVVNFHVNNAKLHSNDEDRITGTGDIWRLVDFCYAAVDTLYDDWFGEDQFTYRTDPVKSMALSRELFGMY